MNMNLVPAALALATSAFLVSGAANAATVFTDGATQTSGIERGVGTLNVNFNVAAAGSYGISFDLLGRLSLDGYGNGWDDLFTVALNGTTVFEGYFNLGGGGKDNVVTNAFSWSWTAPGYANSPNWAGGIVGISGIAPLVAGQNTLGVSFSSPGPNNGGGQWSGDESWALNNVNVSDAPFSAAKSLAAVPVPAALPLLLAGLAGLGMAGLRKRKAKLA